MATSRYQSAVKDMRASVLESAGATAPELRRAAASREAHLPQELAGFIGKVHALAYKVTEEDVQALRAAGYSEDALFELTVSAALGAGLERLDAALAAVGRT
ncbi:MAG: hypothetical protein L0Y66_08930 [Myxococcaceae bacterium]|nr:hypothetical protein [Myxococcaceae bacterium]MCI0673694.1 hypothetical protein [Myxococcaceae bacterium]